MFHTYFVCLGDWGFGVSVVGLCEGRECLMRKGVYVAIAVRQLGGFGRRDLVSNGRVDRFRTIMVMGG